jgi:DNA-binding IclR family transcriptional regulator
MKDGKKEQILNSVLRTFEVAELLAGRGELGVTRIAEEVGLDKSSVYRILATLKSIGYVCQNPATQGYANTSRFASLSGGSLDEGNLRDRAHAVLAAMAEEAGEAASLGILEGREILYIDTIQCSGLIRVNLPIGQKLPAYCSGLGKAILAFLPESRVRELFGEGSLEKFTPNTLSSYRELAAELEKVRADGFARDRQESHTELSCLAVPVFGADGKVAAGISLSFPKFRHPEQESAEARLVPLLRKAAMRISADLGFRGPYPGGLLKNNEKAGRQSNQGGK